MLIFLDPSEHDTLSHNWLDVGPASQTMGQHWATTGSINISYLPGFPNNRGWVIQRKYPVNNRPWPNVGLMLGQRRVRWTNTKPTLGQRLMSAEMTGRSLLTDLIGDGGGGGVSAKLILSNPRWGPTSGVCWDRWFPARDVSGTYSGSYPPIFVPEKYYIIKA